MLKKTAFNIRYAYSSLIRGGLWSLFAVFCIAAGVAAVVALRSLGLAIGDTLTSTVRESNNGDITLSRGGNSPFAAITGIEGVGRDNAGSRSLTVFTAEQVESVRQYVAEVGGTMTGYAEASGVSVAAQGAVTAGRPQFLSVFLVDPATYGLLGPIETISPPNTTITDLLLPDERVIVISENFAETFGIEVGEDVRVSGTDEPFTVVGIVPADEEASLFDLVASFFGFAYLHQAHAETINSNPEPNRISVVLPPGTDIVRTARELDQITPRRTSVRNIVTLEEQLGEISDVMGRLIVITGLGALVIGGVGIINTMLVMVRRRTMEIATLKTFGLRGGQIARLFIWEALMLGAAGSIAGVLIGTLLGGVVNNFGEAFLQQALVWRFYPEAAVYGVTLGMSVTVVFGVLPVLTATRVRPAAVMRPNETHVPVVGILQSIGVLLIVVISVGIMVGSILGGLITQRYWGDMLVGLIGTAIAIAIIGVLVVAFWIVVWGMGRAPAFGIVDLRLAIRNLTSRRWRTATTLLALTAGMYALSSIAFVSTSVQDVIRFQLSGTLGGNVLVFPLTTVFASPELAEPFINARLDQLEGISYRTRNDFFDVETIAIDGEVIDFRSLTYTTPVGTTETGSDPDLAVLARRSDNPELHSGVLIAGRDLTPEDAGKPVAVIRADAYGEGALNLQPGQILTMETETRDPQRFELEIVGVIEGGAGSLGVEAYTPLNVIPGRSAASMITVQVEREHLDNALVALSGLPTVFVLDISFVDSLIQRLVDQFSAIPTIVGLLALLAAAAIMANTVLLATLERRKQIGVLKAIGLKSRRVLGVLLLENTLIALLGALIGIGLSSMNSIFISWIGLGIVVPIPANAMPIALLLIGSAVAIAWLSTLASAGVVTRERVATVLRYD